MCKLKMNRLNKFKSLTSLVLMVAVLIFSSYSFEEDYTLSNMTDDDVIIMRVANDNIEDAGFNSSLYYRSRFVERRIIDWYANDTRVNLISFDDESEPEDNGWYA